MITLKRSSTISAALAVSVLLLVGCSGDDKGTTATASAATGTSSSASGSSTSGSTSGTSGSTSTTSSTTSGSTSAASSSDSCSIFGCETDAIPCCCDLYTQDCPDGEKCSAWSNDGSTWNDKKCVPVVPDPKQVGEACTAEYPTSGLDDCDEGLMCWDVDENHIGYCIEFCKGSEEAPSCADPTALCVIANDGALPLCLPACDPLLQDCPGKGTCLPLGDGFFCAVDDSGPDAGADGDPCMTPNACDPGLYCASPDFVPGCMAAGCCASFCDLNQPNTCPLKDQGAECLPFYDMGMAPPGKENLGSCGLPG